MTQERGASLVELIVGMSIFAMVMAAYTKSMESDSISNSSVDFLTFQTDLSVLLDGIVKNKKTLGFSGIDNAHFAACLSDSSQGCKKTNKPKALKLWALNPTKNPSSEITGRYDKKGFKCPKGTSISRCPFLLKATYRPLFKTGGLEAAGVDIRLNMLLEDTVVYRARRLYVKEQTKSGQLASNICEIGSDLDPRQTFLRGFNRGHEDCVSLPGEQVIVENYKPMSCPRGAVLSGFHEDGNIICQQIKQVKP